jgi:hypothetical protein
LGIKSATTLYYGVKSSVEEAKNLYVSAKKLIATIKELPKKLKKPAEKKLAKSSIDYDLPECIANPAKGWQGSPGPRGGAVCPEVSNLFALVESYFSTMRQDLLQMDFLRKEKKAWRIKWGNLSLRILNTYPLYNGGKGEYFDRVNKLYQEAKRIKLKSQNLWAVAIAMDFANQNFTCGKSFCMFPLCISGIPLTPEPLSNPFGYLIYILRYPLLNQVKVLENALK